MQELKGKLKVLFLLIAPFVITAVGWNSWWILWTLLILAVAVKLTDSVDFAVLVLATIAGFALKDLALAYELPYALYLKSYLYPLGYWLLCFFLF